MKGIFCILARCFAFSIFSFILLSCASLSENLIQATQKGDLGRLRRMINQDENVQTSHLSKLLPFAVAYDRKDVVELLVRSGAKFDASEEVITDTRIYKGSAVFIAAAKGHKDLLLLFIKSEADVQGKGSVWQRPKGGRASKLLLDNVSPLYAASHREHRDIVKILLEEYLKQESAEDDIQDSLLIAARLRRTAILDLFIEAGADTQKAYKTLAKSKEDHEANEILKDRSRRKIRALSHYHSIVDQCEDLHLEAKSTEKRYLYNRINRKLRSLFRKCSRITLRKICRKLVRDKPYKERRSLEAQCRKNASNCCQNCVSIEDHSKEPYRCYSRQSLFED